MATEIVTPTRLETLISDYGKRFKQEVQDEAVYSLDDLEQILERALKDNQPAPELAPNKWAPKH